MKIKVEIKGVTIQGDAYEIVKILTEVYKVPSTTIDQLMGELGLSTTDPRSDRPITMDDGKCFWAII